MARRRRARAADRRVEAGTGLVGTLFGVTAFLLFLLLAVQLLLGLYTTTVVTSAAADAANELSHAPDPTSPDEQRAVADRATARLGGFAQRPGGFVLDWKGTDADNVVLTVHARKMTVLPAAFGQALGSRIDRTIRVRVERLR